ncbi:MAG: folate-binding protein YgfZ [Myxococcales bacterium]|nr:folate-binding protein YgfZ [Myxococcales bacterium]
MIIDRSTWGRLRLTGGDRVRFLQGLTTVNAAALADGAHGWGAILSPKGRVLSVIDIRHAGDAFVIACEASLAEKTRAILERYAVMDDVAFEPITGPAHQNWHDITAVWSAPIVEGAGAAAAPDSDPAVERLRIRAGFLHYGFDVDEDHFPFETPIGQFIDYGKGCYVGQEPVFRVHAQGNAARTLRGLTIEGAEPIARGAQIKHAQKANAGAVTSSVADGSSTVALGYLHRTCWDAGGTVEVDGRRATVHEIPW